MTSLFDERMEVCEDPDQLQTQSSNAGRVSPEKKLRHVGQKLPCNINLNGAVKVENASLRPATRIHDCWRHLRFTRSEKPKCFQASVKRYAKILPMRLFQITLQMTTQTFESLNMKCHLFMSWTYSYATIQAVLGLYEASMRAKEFVCDTIKRKDRGL